MPRRGPLLLTALWVAAAAVATAVGLLAVQLVAGQVGETGADPLDARAVDDALGSAAPSRPSSSPTALPTVTADASARPSASPVPRPSLSRRPGTSGPVGTITTRGGTVSARCVSGDPRLVLATPAEGYRTDDSSGSRVRFESSRERVEVRISCTSAGRPAFAVRTDERDDDADADPERSRVAVPEVSSLGGSSGRG